MNFLSKSDVVTILAVVISATATLLAIATSSDYFLRFFMPHRLILRNYDYQISPHDETTEVLTPAPSGPRFLKAKSQVLVRINDARTSRADQFFSSRRGRWASNSLIFGQYVIGAAMATSFTRETLSPKIISIFGLLVVLSTVVKQHYHPEINAQIASQKVDQLEALIRQSEDRLVIIETTMTDDSDDPAAILELLEKISAELTKISSTTKAPGSRQRP